MSAERKFTLNLRQNNTGKTAQIVITQQGKPLFLSMFLK